LGAEQAGPLCPDPGGGPQQVTAGAARPADPHLLKRGVRYTKLDSSLGRYLQYAEQYSPSVQPLCAKLANLLCGAGPVPAARGRIALLH
jgi:hypothetical protein